MSLPFAARSLRIALGLPEFEPGWVWLVGAGPGDPGLLTLHGLSALQQADIVVYDALVDESVLKLARPGAEVEYAGKRGGKPSAKQRDISLRLITWAKMGKRVLRLKGGDPFLFGRGGEEALALVGAGIPMRVVPGVTSGVGGLAYAGIPSTHRDINHAVTFVTGHTADDTLNWSAISQGAPVLVIYMGLRQLPKIAAELMKAGRSKDEPVAIISKATTKNQRVLETVLDRAALDVEASGIPAPALIVVGEVVRLRQGLDWLSALGGIKLDADPLDSKPDAQESA